MILNAEVKEDGTLVAKAPKYLSGKNIQIMIKVKKNRDRNGT